MEKQKPNSERILIYFLACLAIIAFISGLYVGSRTNGPPITIDSTQTQSKNSTDSFSISKSNLDHETRIQTSGKSNTGAKTSVHKNNNQNTDGSPIRKTICPKCNGNGVIFPPCPNCYGKTTILCYKCNGTGQEQCWCHRGGCKFCHGTGQRSEYPSSTQVMNGDSEIRKVDCSHCNGTGICSKCNNEGHYTCSICYGAGDLPCTICNKSGISPYSKQCPLCKGQKFILN